MAPSSGPSGHLLPAGEKRQPQNASAAIAIIVSAPASIAGGDVDKLVLKFVPQAEASYENTLSFDSDDEDHPHLELSLKGIGSTRAAVSVDPETLDFDRVAECGSSVLLFSIRSTGTADLVINSIGFVDGGSDAFSFVGSTRTPATIATTDPDSGLPGEIQVTVRAAAPLRARPTGAVGWRSAVGSAAGTAAGGGSGVGVSIGAACGAGAAAPSGEDSVGRLLITGVSPGA